MVKKVGAEKPKKKGGSLEFVFDLRTKGERKESHGLAGGGNRTTTKPLRCEMAL